MSVLDYILVYGTVAEMGIKATDKVEYNDDSSSILISSIIENSTACKPYGGNMWCENKIKAHLFRARDKDFPIFRQINYGTEVL